MPAETQTDAATDALRQAILTGALAPGATLGEMDLTRQIGLGRAPVRTALARLAEEGLVDSVPRRGWVVSSLGIRDAREIFALRLVLEAEAARLAAVAGGHLDDLRAAETALRSPFDANDRTAAAAHFEARRRFHVALAERAGNGRLARQVGRLCDETTWLRFTAGAATDIARLLPDTALVEAISVGDGPEAAAILCEHLAALRTALLG